MLHVFGELRRKLVITKIMLIITHFGSTVKKKRKKKHERIIKIVMLRLGRSGKSLFAVHVGAQQAVDGGGNGHSQQHTGNAADAAAQGHGGQYPDAGSPMEVPTTRG